jgi:hypothetical protein
MSKLAEEFAIFCWGRKIPTDISEMEKFFDKFLDSRLDKKVIGQANEYARSISKNDTYQKYIIDAFIAGYKFKQEENQ